MRDNSMVFGKFEMAPACLYPTEGIASIKDKQVREYCEAYNKGRGQQQMVCVIRYKENYYIYEGHEQVLAALSCGIDQIEVTEIDRCQLNHWGDEKEFKESLQMIGMTALYDFEAAGGFTYKTYPECYQGRRI